MTRVLITLLLSISFLMPNSWSQSAKKVILDHDGGVDDILSLLLLTQMDDIDLLGVCVTPADCFLEDATASTLKILKMTGRTDCPVAQGNTRPVNPFPNEWRAQPMVLNAFPQMLMTDENTEQISKLTADQFIADELRKSSEKVSFVIVGPCSNLVKALEDNSDLISKVKEVIWMGGAIDVRGNVATHKHNGTAEWNAYWDPIATKKLFKLGLDIKLISLDITNSVPVNIEFLKRLAHQADYPLSDLASQFWATTINTIPSYEYTYFMWDVLTTAYVGNSEIFTTEKIELDASTNLPNEGQTFRKQGSGQFVNVAKTVEVDKFYDYILELLKG